MAELNLVNRPIHELAAGLAAKEFSAAELVAAYADRVAAKDGEIKAFLKLDREQVLKAAEAADARRAAGKPPSDFDGIPVGIKDRRGRADLLVRVENSCAGEIPLCLHCRRPAPGPGVHPLRPVEHG